MNLMSIYLEKEKVYIIIYTTNVEGKVQNKDEVIEAAKISRVELDNKKVKNDKILDFIESLCEFWKPINVGVCEGENQNQVFMRELENKFDIPVDSFSLVNTIEEEIKIG